MTTVTRFAPSPNGPLHLGHAYAALVAHDLARERGGEFLIRVEDIDGERSRDEWIEEHLADLAWLGIESDRPVVRQSERLESYDAALDRLKADPAISSSVFVTMTTDSMGFLVFLGLASISGLVG